MPLPLPLSPIDAAIVQDIRTRFGSDARLVFVAGNFNVLHAGHLRLLQFAADRGDHLVVGVNPEGTAGAHMAAELRLEAVRSLSCVADAFILSGEPAPFIAALRPDIVVKGKEHESQPNSEQAAVDDYGGQLLFSSGELSFSTIELLRREFRDVVLPTIVKPDDYPRRHGFDAAMLKRTLSDLHGMRVLVIGDLIIDEYIACEPVGMSREDPTLVVTPLLYEKFVGGAGIVAGHAAGLGAEVSFISIAGNDATATFASERISSFGVDAVLCEDKTRPTTLKQRFRAAGKTLLRVSHLQAHEISRDQQAVLLSAVEARLPQTDLIVFSDFNYGCLPQRLVDAIISLACERGVKMVADSQSSSQVGDISRFSHMLLIKPTEHEARLALRDFRSGLVVLAHELRAKSKATNVVITLGSEGLLVDASMPGASKGLTDRLPAFNNSPKDVAGAGDSFLVATSLAVAAGADIWLGTYLGSIAAACQVGRIGNLPLTTADLVVEIEQ